MEKIICYIEKIYGLIPPINEWSWNAIIALTTLATLYVIWRENRRNAYLPYIKILHDELNDIVISLYYLFNSQSGQNEAYKENYKQQYDGFLNGHRYFVISSIVTDQKSIKNRIKDTGRKIMYFNELRKRYVRVYEALVEAANKSKNGSLKNYFTLTEYEKIYIAYKDMEDISADR